MRKISCVSVSAVLVLVCLGARGQRDAKPQIVWEPPAWDFPQDLKASIPKPMLTTFHIGTVGVTLEETKMDDVEHHSGGEMGGKGDAGEFLEWLCFHGGQGQDKWVFWLESGEIDGGRVGGFQWRRVSDNTNFDPRCRPLKDTEIKLSPSLRLGMTEPEVIRVLGKPTFKKDNGTIIYLHEHQESIEGIPYDSSNIVMIGLDNGKVVSIAVSKTTSS